MTITKWLVVAIGVLSFPTHRVFGELSHLESSGGTTYSRATAPASATHPEVQATAMAIDELIADARSARQSRSSASFYSTELGIEIYLKKFRANLLRWTHDPALSTNDRSIILDNADIVLEFNAELLALSVSHPSLSYVDLQAMAIANLRKRWRLTGKSSKLRYAPSVTDSSTSRLAAQHLAIRQLYLNPESSAAQIKDAAFALYQGDLKLLEKDGTAIRSVEPVDYLIEAAKQDPKQLVLTLMSDAGNQLLARNPEKKADIEAIASNLKSMAQTVENNYNDHVRGKTRDEIANHAWEKLKAQSKEIRDLEDSMLRISGGPEQLTRLINDALANPAQLLKSRGNELLTGLKRENPELARETENTLEIYRTDFDSLQRTLNQAKPTLESGNPEAIARLIADEIRPRSQAVREAEALLNRNLQAAKKVIETIQQEFKNEQPHKKLEIEARNLGRSLESQFNEKKSAVESDLQRLLRKN